MVRILFMCFYDSPTHLIHKVIKWIDFSCFKDIKIPYSRDYPQLSNFFLQLINC